MLSVQVAMPQFEDVPSPFREWLLAADAATATKGFNVKAT